jgi:hypothetical protein
MSKERKVRNFDFLKQTPPPLPSREEVIQKTAELTGQSAVGEEKTPSVSAPIEVIAAPVLPVEAVAAIVSEAVVEAVAAAKPVEKEKKTVQKRQKTAEPPPPVVQAIVEKSKVGRRALADARKPFTTTITLNNKRQLRQLCAEHDIAMSDVINEILAAHFEQRTPNF